MHVHVLHVQLKQFPLEQPSQSQVQFIFFITSIFRGSYNRREYFKKDAKHVNYFLILNYRTTIVAS